MKTREFLEKRFLLPPVFVLVTNLLSSFLTRPFISSDRFFDISTAFDEKIPFIPQFIYIYILAFLQWAICIIAVMVKDRGKSTCYCIGISMGNLISGIIFVAFPTVMALRPQYSAAGITGELVRFIFSADTPAVNLLPSIHCLESYGCMRMVLSLKDAPKALKTVNTVFTVLVFLSVLFIKQHLIFDVFAGAITFEAGLFLTRKIFLKKNKYYKEGYE